MNTTTGFIVLLGFSIVTLGVAMQSQFKVLGDDKKAIKALVPEIPSGSRIACAANCQRNNDCNAFGFSKSKALCQLANILSHIKTNLQLRDSPGFKFYIISTCKSKELLFSFLKGFSLFTCFSSATINLTMV